MGGRIRRALEMARAAPALASGIDVVVAEVGTSALAVESVPAAFAVVVLAGGDPWRACATAAALGGDTDTIAAMAGAIAGACAGVGSLPYAALKVLRDVNQLGFETLVDGLLALRRGAAGGTA